MAETTDIGAFPQLSKVDGLAMAINKMAVSLHRLLAEKKGNVFFSPYSVSTAMAMVYWAAESKTGAEMKVALGFEELSKDDIVTGFEQIMSSLANINDSCTLSTANSLVIANRFYVKDLYKSVLKESFKAYFLEVNLRKDSEQAVKDINEWVKSKTNDKISKLIDSLGPNVVMLLLNAVYFKGSWLHKFNKSKTSSKKFYNQGDKKKAKSVKMMHIKKSFRLAGGESFQALQLPYVGEDIAMLILLPRQLDGLEALEASISPTFLQDLTRRMFSVEVTVALPRFRLKYSESLVESFKRLGVDRLFIEAELGGASDAIGLYASDILHEAVLEVNEEGSEAVAATAVIIALRSVPQKYEFIVDHPFAFVIYDVKSNLILFMGRVEEL